MKENKRYLQQLKFINETILYASRMQDENQICNYIGEKIYSIHDKAVIVVSLYDEKTDSIKVKNICGENELLERLTSFLGFDPYTMSFERDKMKGDTSLNTCGKLVKVPGGIYQITEGKISKKLCDKIEKIIGPINVYTVGFALDDEPYGSIILLLPQQQHVKFDYAIETIASNISVLLQRLKTNKLLSENKERLDLALKGANLGTWDWNIETDKVKFSELWANMKGYSTDEIEPTLSSWKNLVHPDDLPTVMDKLDDHLKGNTDYYEAEFRMRHKTGYWVWIQDRGRVIERDNHGQPRRACGTHLDITERKRTEEALAREQHLLRTLLDNSPDHIYFKDEKSRFILINRAQAKTFGVENPEDSIGKTDFDFFDKKHAQVAFKDEKSIMTTGQPIINKEEKEVWPDGRESWVLTNKGPLYGINGEIIGTFGISRDITSRKNAEQEKEKLEERLRRAQKLETIGTLAGGIAHDFNNILTPILGYADMGLATLSTNDPLYNHLEAILKGAHRAKDLVQQILLFSRNLDKEKEPLHLHLIVKEAVKFLRSSIPSTIQINQNIHSNCPMVLADPTQLHEVVVNLCSNAYHAMEEQGGELSIELEHVHVDAESASLHPDLEEKDYVRLTVRDTGVGMDENTLAHIFEPFYTTKNVNKGTGMGLSVVHGIVKSHDGCIHVESEPGKGSTFQVYLPTTSYKETDETVSGDKKMGQGEQILVVDDEEPVLQLVKMMLEKLGYKAEPYDNSRQALAALEQNPHHYNVVITDLTMPELTGQDIAQEIKKINADIPIILITGYGENIKGKTDQYNFRHIIGKPIKIDELASAIEAVLQK